MKWLSLVALLATLIFTFGEYPGSYSLGWVTGWVWHYFNPFSELPVLMVCLPLLLACWLISLFLRRNRIWTTAMMIAALVSIGLVLFVLPPPGFLTVYGIRDHIMKVATLADLRGLAREVDNDQLWADEDEMSMSGARLEKLRLLQQKYPYLAWGLSGLGNPYVRSDDHTVNIEWGGALPGHWGFSVSANGTKNDPPTGPDLRVIRMSDDIYFYHGD